MIVTVLFVGGSAASVIQIERLTRPLADRGEGPLPVNGWTGGIKARPLRWRVLRRAET